jgi:hypothetical protein
VTWLAVCDSRTITWSIGPMRTGEQRGCPRTKVPASPRPRGTVNFVNFRSRNSYRSAAIQLRFIDLVQIEA